MKKLDDSSTATQQDITERALKKARRKRPNEFCQKGHEEQFAFNVEIGIWINTAASKMSKLGPTLEKDKMMLQQAMSELKEGMDMIAKRQKHIRNADQSEHHWETVVAYKGSNVVDDEEDARCIEKAERTAEYLVNRKKSDFFCGVKSQEGATTIRASANQCTNDTIQPWETSRAVL